MKHKLFPLVAGTALLLALAGPAAHAAPEGSPSSSADVPPLPAQELSADVLFLILLGEIAGNRGDLPVSAEAYLHAARQTLDPRIARRATEIALVARDMDTAAAAARIWLDTEPNSEEARRMLADLLSDLAYVVPTSTLIEEGLFGSVSERFLERVGNLVLLPKADRAIWWHEKGRYGQHFHAMHGGLSRFEMEIPFLFGTI